MLAFAVSFCVIATRSRHASDILSCENTSARTGRQHETSKAFDHRPLRKVAAGWRHHFSSAACRGGGIQDSATAERQTDASQERCAPIRQLLRAVHDRNRALGKLAEHRCETRAF